MNDIIKSILDNKEDFLITGNNGVGKSFIAFELLGEFKEFYYIGVVNHSFKLRTVPEYNEFDYKAIVDKRLIEKGEYEAKAFDTYGKYATDVVAKVIGEEFIKLLESERIKKEIIMALENFNIKLNFMDSKMSLEIEGITFSKDDGKDISIGYQTILRIFTELFVLKTKTRKKFIVFLDEVSKSLDSFNSLKLLEVLKEFFPNYQFIITTHSYDLILGARDSKVVKINANKINQYFDIKDYKTVNEIRTQIFGVEDDRKIDDVEELLYKIGNIIDNIRSKKSAENYNRLEEVLKEAEAYKDKSNKVKVMYNFASKILGERK